MPQNGRTLQTCHATGHASGLACLSNHGRCQRRDSLRCLRRLRHSTRCRSRQSWSMTSCVVRRLLPWLLLVHLALADHYSTLGVPRDASAATIKTAFRKAALAHHPDRTRKLAAAQRQTSQRLFEQMNEAFEVLGDPALRRQYDFELANPERSRQQQAAAGAAAAGTAPPPMRPTVEVRVFCTLEELGGWREATVPLSAWSSALGATVTEEIANRLGLPLRLGVPPGSRSGERLRYAMPALGPAGVDVDFVLLARPHGRWDRRGDDLFCSLTLPAWHNWLRRAYAACSRTAARVARPESPLGLWTQLRSGLALLARRPPLMVALILARQGPRARARRHAAAGAAARRVRPPWTLDDARRARHAVARRRGDRRRRR
eukprot:6516908-Prymnesium_polylepis.2